MLSPFQGTALYSLLRRCFGLTAPFVLVQVLSPGDERHALAGDGVLLWRPDAARIHAGRDHQPL